MYSNSYLLFQSLTAVAIGDSLGCSQQNSKKQFPIGTWSDDTSLTIASLYSLSYGFNLDDLMIRYSQWLRFGDYTPFNRSFDVGKTTYEAITNYQNGVPVELCGIDDEFSNGNGALMRIMPLCFFILNRYRDHYEFNDETANLIHQFTAVTHRHKRSLIASGILANIIIQTIINPNKIFVISAVKEAIAYYDSKPEFKDEIILFYPLLNINACTGQNIKSSGYVIDTLYCVLWSVLISTDYETAVNKALSLGGDADTIGSITSLVASIIYAPILFPEEWTASLKSKYQLRYVASVALNSHNF